MSQKVSTRKSAVSDDKQRQTDSPVKDMKKKMAANAEKEKQAAERNADKSTDKPAEKSSKPTEKQSEKNPKTSEKPSDKSAKSTGFAGFPVDKQAEKNAKTSEKPTEKPAEKNVKSSEKQTEKDKKVDKKEAQAEKEEESKSDKPDKQEEKDKKKQDKKQNGQKAHNGVSDVTLNANGQTEEVLNGAVSADSEDEVLVIDDHDQDELFPELTYDDTSDVECFEPPTPDSAPASRSFTRRSQVKASRTPETPRPASDKQTDVTSDDPKESKVLKLKDDVPNTDRKLRSSDSPKPESKKEKAQEAVKKGQETPKKKDDKAQDSPKKQGNESKEQEKEKNDENKSTEVIIEIDVEEGAGTSASERQRKPDTNYSKSRVKVSPYRRAHVADITATSILANYTGNNTTMEMDITETSSFMEEPSLVESPYLNALRTVRGRRSYRAIGEGGRGMTLPHLTANRTVSSTPVASEQQPMRPTGTVVGRKRKPDGGEGEGEGEEGEGEEETGAVGVGGGAGVVGKRMRLLDRIAHPFRRTVRARAEIVGINTDLPLTAPVASPAFDPESLKGTTATATTVPTPLPPAVSPLPPSDSDTKKCLIM